MAKIMFQWPLITTEKDKNDCTFKLFHSLGMKKIIAITSYLEMTIAININLKPKKTIFNIHLISIYRNQHF